MATLKVLFWNLQRSGAREGSLPTDMLKDDLAALSIDAASRDRPDIMVLCEAGVGFDGNRSMLPDTWQFVTQRSTNLYTPTMLRYVVMKRAGLSCTATLLDTSAAAPGRHLRPALAVRSSGIGVAALHAYSNPSSPAIQVRQLDVTHRLFRARFRTSPDLLIGDFNIDYGDTDRRAEIRGYLHQSPLGAYQLRGPREGTHAAGKTLDWAMVHPGAQVAISRIAPVDPDEAEREQRERRYLKIAFTNRKQADHVPILATVG